MRLVLVLVLLASSGIAAAQEAPPAAAPPAWRYQLTEAPPVRERRWELFTAGMVIFSCAWVANLQAGIATQEGFLDLPLVGPLLEAARIGGGGNPFVGMVDFFLVTDALVQMGGLAMVIAGAATHHDVHRHQQRLELVPLAAGAALRGTF